MAQKEGRGGQETVRAVDASLLHEAYIGGVCESQYPGRVRKLREDEVQRVIRWDAEKSYH